MAVEAMVASARVIVFPCCACWYLIRPASSASSKVNAIKLRALRKGIVAVSSFSLIPAVISLTICPQV